MQFPFAHWELFWHEPPFAALLTQAPPEQYFPMLSQLVVFAVLHAPAPLQAVLDVAVFESEEQLALVHEVEEPGYAHCVSDDPSQRPAHVADPLLQAV